MKQQCLATSASSSVSIAATVGGIRTARAALIALAAVASPASAQSEKAFQFMGLDTTTIYRGELVIAGKKCRIKGVGSEQCERDLGARIGDSPVEVLVTKFRDGKLISVHGVASTSDFAALDEAFTIKYGPAKSVEHPVWQNQAGATFDNSVKSWVFRDGVLQLTARGASRDTAEIVFLSTDGMPAKVPQPTNF